MRGAVPFHQRPLHALREVVGLAQRRGQRGVHAGQRGVLQRVVGKGRLCRVQVREDAPGLVLGEQDFGMRHRPVMAAHAQGEEVGGFQVGDFIFHDVVSVGCLWGVVPLNPA